MEILVPRSKKEIENPEKSKNKLIQNRSVGEMSKNLISGFTAYFPVIGPTKLFSNRIDSLEQAMFFAGVHLRGGDVARHRTNESQTEVG